MSNFTMALPLASCDKGVNKLFNEIKIKKRKKKNFPVVAPTTKKKGTCTCLCLYFFICNNIFKPLLLWENRELNKGKFDYGCSRKIYGKENDNNTVCYVVVAKLKRSTSCLFVLCA